MALHDPRISILSAASQTAPSRDARRELSLAEGLEWLGVTDRDFIRSQNCRREVEVVISCLRGVDLLRAIV